MAWLICRANCPKWKFPQPYYTPPFQKLYLSLWVQRENQGEKSVTSVCLEGRKMRLINQAFFISSDVALNADIDQGCSGRGPMTTTL